MQHDYYTMEERYSMRFSAVIARHYRKNGYLFIAKDDDTGYYDVYIQSPSGKATWVDAFTNKGIAIKEVKYLAMTKRLGFNSETDII